MGRYYAGIVSPRGVAELRNLGVLPKPEWYEDSDSIYVSHMHLNHLGALSNIPTRAVVARHILDQHLRAVRTIKEEIMYNWVRYIRQIASNYFIMRGFPIDEEKLWQEEFDDTLWKHIENFLKNLMNLPLWVDR